MKRILSCALIASLFYSVALLAVSTANAQNVHAPDRVMTRYIGLSGATLAQLSQGATGAGLILYYLESQGPDRPTVVVRLSKTSATSNALAEVYEPFPGSKYLQLTIDNGSPKIDASYNLAITMKSLDGWWVRHGKPSYNLDVQISGPMYAMGGEGFSQESGFTGWASKLHPGEPAVELIVRDPKHTGTPVWDWRTRLPQFQGDAYIGTNYAEEECGTSRQIIPSASPMWPYITTATAYQQPVGKFLPPIGADWKQGKIIYFSELVAVRNQNCSYSINALNTLKGRITNSVDFEAPFAFYDLSGHDLGYPDLIIRSEHYPAQDSWTKYFFYPQSQVPSPSDLEWIRYTWSYKPGAGLMQYKIDVMGTYPYDSVTSLAGGSLKINAPSYKSFPDWVIHKKWPVVTFVAAEGQPYVSNEGIYEYSSHDAGPPYLLGWESRPTVDSYQIAQAGLRSEYRVSQDTPPHLYLSRLDYRLHLLGAEGGIWDLGNGQVVRLHNLAGTEYIDGWTREVATREPVAVTPGTPTVTSTSRLLESLYAFNGYLLYASENGVELKAWKYQPDLLDVSPPKDQASWIAGRDQLLRYGRTSRSPGNLLSWIRGFSGPDLAVKNATISDVRASKNGFRFLLHLRPGFVAKDGLARLLDQTAAGDYLVRYNGRLGIERLTPPALSAAIVSTTSALNQLVPGMIRVVLHNSGTEDAGHVSLELLADKSGGHQRIIGTWSGTLLGSKAQTVEVQWVPPAGTWTLTPKLRLPSGRVFEYAAVRTRIPPVGDSAVNVVMSAGGSRQSGPVVLFLLATCAVLAALALMGHAPAGPNP
jgi:hypothetical protein